MMSGKRLRSRGKDSGFSVFELLVALSIFAIVSLFAVPRVSELLQSFDKRNAEMQVLQDMRLMQATTVEEGCQGIMTVSTDHSSYSFGCDYVPFSNASPPVWDSVRFTRNLPPHVSITIDSTVIFNSRGQCISTTGDLTSRTVTLSVTTGSGSTFSTGTLRPTGFFTFGG